MTINFTKMHGLGNDFMVIDGINQKINLSPEFISSLAQRSTGVGFDQCLLIQQSEVPGIDFNYRIFNADGQEVGQCGNGARCLALFAKHYGLTQKNKFKVATKTTQMNLQINADNSVSVEMDVPRLAPEEIPFCAESQAPRYSLELTNGQRVEFHAISVGNPHAVVVVSDLQAIPLHTLGQQISVHQCFPEHTNVEFMQIINTKHIRIRVYERGCGETQACGSGAVAAAAVARLFHHMSEQITVSLPGGDLLIDWPDIHGPIILTGPAAFIYEGRL